MKIREVIPILNVSSVPASIEWFEKLGWKRGFTWNSGGTIEGNALRNEHGDGHFGSVCVDEHSIFLCRDGQGSRGTMMPKFPGDDETDGVWMSWFLGNPAEVDEMHALAITSGYTVTMPPTDEPWGVREFHLRHPDGHMFRVGAGNQEE
ncbi:MAG TPA: VOC family protein [Gemmatimonadaceae bacterium]|nr:VOC family protein [Gemmatimonadaceae bacterium]